MLRQRLLINYFLFLLLLVCLFRWSAGGNQRDVNRQRAQKRAEAKGKESLPDANKRRERFVWVASPHFRLSAFVCFVFLGCAPSVYRSIDPHPLPPPSHTYDKQQRC
jgi:hypothetical protein